MMKLDEKYILWMLVITV